MAKAQIGRHKRNLMSKETEALLTELKRWCDAERGRRAELSRALKVPPQLVSDWFAKRKTPTWEQGLRIQVFIETTVRGKDNPGKKS
jgi:hypothetical protein